RRLAQDLSYGIPAEKLGISHGRSSKDGYHIYRVPPTISLGFPLLKICGSPSHSALPRDVDWQVLDARLLNRLWVELHQRQYFLRHAHFDGEPQLAGFSCSKRVVMRQCPPASLSARASAAPWSIRGVKSSTAPRLTCARAFSPISARTSVMSKTLPMGFVSRALTMLAAGNPAICGSIGPSIDNSPSTISLTASAISVPPDMA